MNVFKKIILDTDPGHDDAMAIMLAVKSENFEIQAITTVAGNYYDLENTTKNAKYIIDLLKSDIPLYSGCDKPLKKELIKAVVHGESGLAGIDPHVDIKLSGDAVDRIISIVKKNPNGITLVALGPLTNIATAIIKNPLVMRKVKQIIIMGGAIKVPGNKNRVAEFNFFVDPDAAKIVIEFDIDKVLVPLDACNHIQMTMSDFKMIKNYTIKTPLLKMMKPYIENISQEEGVKAALMYDPLTVYYLLSPKNCRVQNYNVQVETVGEFTRGMTVVDLRNNKDKLSPNCRVVEKINKDKFIKDFIKILSR